MIKNPKPCKSGEQATMVKYSRIIIFLVLCFCGCAAGHSDENTRVGWAIGNRPDNTAIIFHTGNGGATWEAQGDARLWPGHDATDVSAVNATTAWASLNSSLTEGGMILFTGDGGLTWQVQTLPQDIPEGVKGIKGVSPNEAWAVGLRGPVLHTINGGATWEIVPTPGITLRQVNRIDVRGNDIWIADFGSGGSGMVHSADGGMTWRHENLPDVPFGHGPMTASIVNSGVAWTSVNMKGDLYRTLDGGTTWNIDAPDVSGPNDIDDVCAVGAHEVWAVQNTSGGGAVMRIKIVGAEVIKSDWYFPDYVYEGVSAMDGMRAWIGGFRAMGTPTSYPRGSILRTSDGGATWSAQKLPVDDADVWKISFVGACR